MSEDLKVLNEKLPINFSENKKEDEEKEDLKVLNKKLPINFSEDKK